MQKLFCLAKLMCTLNPNDRNLSGSNCTCFTGTVSEEIQAIKVSGTKKELKELAASQFAGAETFSFSPIN